jgi:hypothetical protein
MAKTIKPGHTSLDMEDISDDLVVKYHHVSKLDIDKRISRSMDEPVDPAYYGEIINADDTDLVAGVRSNLIAVAESPSDRTTVRNSSNLGEQPASYYMPKGQCLTMINDVDTIVQAIRNKYLDEITELRDEVIQLRMELSKNGVTHGYDPYEGFYDMFRRNFPMHEYKPIANAAADSVDQYNIEVENTVFDRFFVGDKIRLKNLGGMGEEAIVEILIKQPDGKTLTFDRATGFDIFKDKCDVYKVKGNVINGTFTFGEIVEEKPSKKEIYSCLDDDTFRLRRQIRDDNTGYATTFRIPAIHQKNFLAKVDIQVRKYGDPGALMCYIMDERDVPLWKNAKQAIEDNDPANPNFISTKYIFFAKSQPLTVDSSAGEHLVTFSFQQEDETFPLMDNIDTTDHKVRYCMIIEALDADRNNYYDILFLQHKDPETGLFGDLQLNNIAYYYEEKSSSSTDSPLTTDENINSSDLYYGITLLEAEAEVFVPYNNGIYSALFKTHDPIIPGRGRVTMRIAREGIFNVDASGSSGIGDLNDGCVIAAPGETVEDVDGFWSSTDNIIAVGTELRTVKTISGDKITLKEGLHVDDLADVYPINYKVKLNCRLKQWNPTTCVTEVLDEEVFELPIKYIMPDRNKRNKTVSDRLIFEADFTRFDPSTGMNKLMKYNDFEVQVYWEHSCKAISAKLAGKIYDIDVTLSRTC